MKVIKVGSTSQSRIAQACDRCRSKKIRCDGVRPCCTQCANVGFECKTSDKLSRRAFPRGYTESLEERVRALESEVRDLKNLLDEKDEKIDVLSRIHSFSSPSQQKARSPSAPVKANASSPSEDVISVPLPSQPEDVADVESAGVSSVHGFSGKCSASCRVRIEGVVLMEALPLTPPRHFYQQTHGSRSTAVERLDSGPESVAISYLTFPRRPGDQDRASLGVRPTHQHLLPRMGPSLPSCAQTHHPQGLRAVPVEYGNSAGQ